ncbi:helix-turn-helix domain-containing protein [Aliarcobacter cryaerophilus]|jgi:hypothetical protein|uniref:helix-turn-helix domain-containing protein n=1 Tax=Aliarcobacter cryaerophilus TaxID=28198 RepID=UPI00112F6959|nr:helix-turn-helix domain-containing protein [Aliarcobacter cryaerophilus]
MNITNMILEKMYSFYNVKTASELSEKINTSQKTISNWKIRNSIGAIKKKCRELGIYPQIFSDLSIYQKTHLLSDNDHIRFENYFDEIFNHYNVSTIKELSEKTNIPQSTISNWSQRKSISALKKATKELGIYEIIFDQAEKNYDAMNLKFNTIQRIKILEEQCEKYNIQTTTIQNKRILYLIEEIDSHIGDDKEIENILKNILLNRILKIPYFSKLDEDRKKQILIDIEDNINKYEEKNKNKNYPSRILSNY